MIEVSRAGPAQAGAIGEIHAASWQAAYAPFFDPTFAAREIASRRTRWHDRIEAGNGTILVAALDGRLLAFSMSVPSTQRPGFAEILSLYAHPDGWGTGVAAGLMTHTLRELRAEGFARAHLWTLRDTPQSRRFYAKAGFAETGASRPRDFGDGNPLPQVEYERAC